jgi:hypothetical protein
VELVESSTFQYGVNIWAAATTRREAVTPVAVAVPFNSAGMELMTGRAVKTQAKGSGCGYVTGYVNKSGAERSGHH